MHSLETIIARNQIEDSYDAREAKRIKEGRLSIAEWSKVLNVPAREVQKLLGGDNQ